jgi:metal-responsive CopG/Arc/MetJ family transcriptional regulator
MAKTGKRNSGKNLVRVNLNLGEEENRMLNEESERTGYLLSRSEIARRAIRLYTQQTVHT